MNKIQRVIIIFTAILILAFGISWFAPAGGIKFCNPTPIDWSIYDSYAKPLTGKVLDDYLQKRYFAQPRNCYFKPLPFWGDYYRSDKSIAGLLGSIITVTIPAGLLYFA